MLCMIRQTRCRSLRFKDGHVEIGKCERGPREARVLRDGGSPNFHKRLPSKLP